MKLIQIFFLLLLEPITARSQKDTVTNSFAQAYKKTNPTINYHYDNLKQIHDYSNNWDFDLDGKKDQVYFIGTGGAHLYYYLRVILNADNVQRDYRFIQSDFPVLPSDDAFNKSGFDPISSFTQFAVSDYNKDSIIDIFVRLDDSSFLSGKKALKKYGVQSNYVIITFKRKKAQFTDYPGAGK